MNRKEVITIKGATFNIKTRNIYAYIMPWFLLFVFSIIIPLLICIYISLTDWKGGPVINFVGLKNYQMLISDKRFWASFLNNLKFIVILLFSQIGLALVFSMFIQSKRIFFKELHRKVIFIPVVLAPMVVGMIWQIVYNSDYGLIAAALKVFGILTRIKWLDSPNLVIYSIAITLTWQYVGQFVIIIMAGMQNISSSILEAAELDGATGIKKGLYVVLPLLKTTLSVCVIICISGCMKMFALVFVMTGGGPGRASQITALYAYDTAFKVHKMGYASAISIGMVLLSLALIIISQVFLKGRGAND